MQSMQKKILKNWISTFSEDRTQGFKNVHFTTNIKSEEKNSTLWDWSSLMSIYTIINVLCMMLTSKQLVQLKTDSKNYSKQTS